jgi:hypothetical protein
VQVPERSADDYEAALVKEVVGAAPLGHVVLESNHEDERHVWVPTDESAELKHKQSGEQTSDVSRARRVVSLNSVKG